MDFFCFFFSASSSFSFSISATRVSISLDSKICQQPGKLVYVLKQQALKQGNLKVSSTMEIFTFRGWFLLMTASSIFFPPDWTTCNRATTVSDMTTNNKTGQYCNHTVVVTCTFLCTFLIIVIIILIKWLLFHFCYLFSNIPTRTKSNDNTLVASTQHNYFFWNIAMTEIKCYSTDKLQQVCYSREASFYCNCGRVSVLWSKIKMTLFLQWRHKITVKISSKPTFNILQKVYMYGDTYNVTVLSFPSH